jgi:putative Mg2+ transporter-C (MgtC) family protein
VSGVGFLGGGVILRQGTSVTGINTAATIWCSAAVGTLAGAGYPLAATTGALLVLTVHLALRPVARHIARLPAADETETVYRFRAVCRAADEAHIRALVVQALANGDFHLRAVHSSDLDQGSDLVEVAAEVSRYGRDDVALEAAVSRLSLGQLAGRPGRGNRRERRGRGVRRERRDAGRRGVSRRPAGSLASAAAADYETVTWVDG